MSDTNADRPASPPRPANKMQSPEAQSADFEGRCQRLERQLREMTLAHKQLEVELMRYRYHFEPLVASRTAELMTINDLLSQQRRQRLAAQSEQHKVQVRLKETSLLLDVVLNAIPDIIGVQDDRHRILQFNRAGYRFFRIHPDEAKSKRCFELMGQSAPCHQCVAEQCRQTGQSAKMEKYIDARSMWLDVRAYPILDERGKVVQVVEHLRDITGFKTSEAALLESEEKYRLLVENANDAIFIYQDHQYRFSNKKARQLARKIGLLTEKSPLVSYIHKDGCCDDDRIAYMNRLNGKDPRPYAVSCRLVTTSGETIWVELNTVNISWKGRPATLNFVRDITHRKKLEQQFHNAQRMESIGTLAGGVAHDFNNLLMGIQGNVSLMLLNMKATDPLYDKLTAIEQCVDSGSRLTRHLLGFARGGQYVIKAVDFNTTLERSADMFARTRKALKIHSNYDKRLWAVMADENQMEQVVLNLLLNAWQAMQGSGDIYLRTDNVRPKDAFLESYALAAGRYIRVEVTDTGNGMDEATCQRIFEPFFTTNAPGNGTGLGLASAFGIIKNHNGVITVHSRVGRGTTFEIYLPATEQPPVKAVHSMEGPLKGTETILLVDDEDYIVNIGQQMLSGLGYHVLTANSGRMAVERFKGNTPGIDLVILDMVMPDLDGGSVFEMIRQLKPGVRILIASGFDPDDRVDHLLSRGRSAFVHKPFKLNLLSQSVRQVLDMS